MTKIMGKGILKPNPHLCNNAEEDLTKVKAELDRPKVGRKARQDGTADTVAPSFPETGGLKYA
ncbi:MAG: hypothetical protein ACPGGK_19430, partial [Pikeienuella sp.]